jgi:hypothetical protein
MDSEVQTKFNKMGARIKVTVIPDWTHRANRRALRWIDEPVLRPVSIDIRRDDAGEYFDLRHRGDVDVQVLDVRPADRHLLLMTREPGQRGQETRSRFLCGHDERSWFVAAVPERARATSVQSAKDALKPQEVWDAIREHGLPMKNRDHRRTEAFIRQGEWFFIPRPRLNVNAKLVLHKEPIRRGAGKPHSCQFLYRTGGEQVYVCPKYPNGLTLAEYRELSQKERDRHAWRVMVRDARVYAKGAVRHPDHKTVWLSFWHQVVMNTETQARAMQHVAFLD